MNQSFQITIRTAENGYIIEALGPDNLTVEPRPFPSLQEILTPEQLSILPRMADAEATATSDEIQEVGTALYKAIFSPPIATAYGRAQGKSKNNVRLCLQIEPLDLVALPWEAMYDGANWLATRSGTPLVRRLATDAEATFPKMLGIKGALRILFLGASPGGPDAIDIEGMAHDLEEKLATQIANKKVELTILLNASLQDLQGKLTEADGRGRKPYHIIYFMGHGRPDAICMDDGYGEKIDNDPQHKRTKGDAYWVSAESLALELQEQDLRLIFLAACETSAQAAGDGNGVMQSFAEELTERLSLPALVAMQYFVSNEKAATLSAEFFAHLAAFEPVDVALAEARVAVIEQEQVRRDVIAPVIYLQSDESALFAKARNWAAIALFGVLPLLIVLGTAIGLLLRNQTIDQSIAYAEQLAAQAQELAAEDAEISTLLSIEALKISQELERYIPTVHQALLDSQQQLYGWGLGEHDGPVQAAVFSQDNQWLFTAFQSGRLWHLSNTGPASVPILLDGHSGNIKAATFSPNSQWLAISSYQTVQLVRVSTENTDSDIVTWHGVGGETLEFSNDGFWLVSYNRDAGEAWLWDLRQAPEIPSPLPLFPSLYKHPYTVASRLKPYKLSLVKSYRPRFFSPDSRWLVTMHSFGATGNPLNSGDVLKFWDLKAESGIEYPLTVTKERLGSEIVFSPDGRWAAVGNYNYLELWRLSDHPAPHFKIYTDYGLEGGPYFDAVAFTWDSRHLITGGPGKEYVRIWEITEADAPQFPATILLPSENIRGLEVSQDNRWLVTKTPASVELLSDTSTEAGLNVWDLAYENPSLVGPVYRGGGNYVMTNAGLVLSESVNDGIEFTALAADGTRRVSRIPAQGELVAISPNANWVVVRSQNADHASARLFNTNLDQISSRPGSFAPAHTKPLRIFLFHSDGEFFSVDSDAQFHRWERTATGFENKQTGTLVSDGSRVLAISENTEKAILYQRSDVNVPVTTAFGEGLAIVGQTITLDLKQIATLSHDPVTSTLRLTETPTLNSGQYRLFPSAALSANGEYAVTSTQPGTIEVWKFDGMRLAHSVSFTINDRSADTAPPRYLFSPDNRWLTIAVGNYVYLLDLAIDPVQWSLIPLIDGYIEHENTTYGFVGELGMAFSPDSASLAIGYSKFLLLWSTENDIDVASPRLLRQLPFDKSIQTLKFSPDGEWLIAGYENDIALWPFTNGNLQGAEPIFIRKHETEIEEFVVSIDSQWLASRDEANTVYLWSLDQQISSKSLPVQIPNNNITVIVFDPVDNRLLTGDEEGAVQRWNTQLAHWDSVQQRQNSACSRVGRNLTRSEWQAFFPNEPYRLTCEAIPASFDIIQDRLAAADELAKQGEIRAAVLDYTELLQLSSGLTFTPTERARNLYVQEVRLRAWTELCDPINAFFCGNFQRQTIPLSPDGIANFDEAVRIVSKLRNGQPEQMIVPEQFAKEIVADILIREAESQIFFCNPEEAERYYRAADIWHPQLQIEPSVLALTESSDCLIENAFELATNGDVNGAISLLSQVIEQDSRLSFDPHAEAMWFAEHDTLAQETVFDSVEEPPTISQQELGIYQKTMSLISELEQTGESAQALSEAESLLPLLDRLSADLAGDLLTTIGNLHLDLAQPDKALDKYTESAVFYHNAKEESFDAFYIEQAFAHESRSEIYRTQGNLDKAYSALLDAIHVFEYQGEGAAPAIFYAHVCWYGSLSGHVLEVLYDECYQATVRQNDSLYDTPHYYTRGVARTLVGDLQGAITDFQRQADWMTLHPENANKQPSAAWVKPGTIEAWIAAIAQGENPITKEVLQQLIADTAN